MDQARVEVDVFVAERAELTEAEARGGGGRPDRRVLLGDGRDQACCLQACEAIPAAADGREPEPRGRPGGTVATTNTLVGVNGLWVIWLLCVPVFLTLAAWTGLHFRCSRGSGWGTRFAWLSVVLLWAFVVIGSASVGFFLIPAALLLVVAAQHTPTATAPPRTS